MDRALDVEGSSRQLADEWRARGADIERPQAHERSVTSRRPVGYGPGERQHGRQRERESDQQRHPSGPAVEIAQPEDDAVSRRGWPLSSTHRPALRDQYREECASPARHPGGPPTRATIRNPDPRMNCPWASRFSGGLGCGDSDGGNEIRPVGGHEPAWWRPPVLPERRSAPGAIFELIEVFYNGQRLRSSRDYLTPAEYEATVHQHPAALPA